MYPCVMGVSRTPLCLGWLLSFSLWSFQTGYPGPLPPVASIPLFNPAQVSQVRERCCVGLAPDFGEEVSPGFWGGSRFQVICYGQGGLGDPSPGNKGFL